MRQRTHAAQLLEADGDLKAQPSCGAASATGLRWLRRRLNIALLRWQPRSAFQPLKVGCAPCPAGLIGAPWLTFWLAKRSAFNLPEAHKHFRKAALALNTGYWLYMAWASVVECIYMAWRIWFR
jgi:hypothetical protein